MMTVNWWTYEQFIDELMNGWTVNWWTYEQWIDELMNWTANNWINELTNLWINELINYEQWIDELMSNEVINNELKNLWSDIWKMCMMMWWSNE